MNFLGRMLIKNENPSVPIALSHPMQHTSIRWICFLIMI